MKTKITLFIYLLVVLNANAQNAVWVEQGKSANIERGNDIAQDNSGNVYITGTFVNSVQFQTTTLTESFGNYCAKYNPNGTLIWAINQVGGNGITFDGNSNMYLFNNTNSSLQKIDLNGNVVWNNTLFTSSTFGSVGIHDVFVKGNDVYVTGFYSGNAIFGSTTINNTNATDGSWDIFIAKFNTSGVFQWAKTAGGTGLDKGYAIYVNSSDEIYATGYYRNSALFNTTTITSTGNSDVYLAKYNAAGNLLWVNSYGSAGQDLAAKIITDATGNLILTGRFNGTIAFGSTSLESSGLDAFIAKFSPSGTPLWAKKITGQFDDEEADIYFDGTNLHFIATTNGNVSIGTTTHPLKGALDICLGKMDTDGNLLWSKLYGGTTDDEGSGISYYSGATYFTGSFKTTANFDSLSLISLGNWDVVTGKIDNTLFNNEYNGLKNTVEIYPNPTNDIVNINYTLANSSNVGLQLTNIQGQVISQTKLDKSSGLQTDTLNLSNQSSGMYFVTITTETESFTTKVIKR